MVLEQSKQNMDTTTMESALVDNQQEFQTLHVGPHKRRSSYRILGTPQLDTQNSGSNEATSPDVEKDDPMAWADLEAFGGTKKSLEKEVIVPKELTPEEVREQLRELQEIDVKMDEAAKEKRSKQGVLDTITWLKQRSQSEEAIAAEENQRRKRSSSFVRSVLAFFNIGSRNQVNEQHLDNNIESIRTENTEDEEEHFQKLEVPWGQSALACDWSQVGFKLLNQAIVEDIERVRHVIKNGELQTASPQAITALATWLRLFDQHVDHVESLKQYLLEERSLLAGVGYKVTTIYDVYRESLERSISLIHGDREELGAALLHTFATLEAILNDEILAVQDVIKQTLHEEQEYVAISELFHHLGMDDACGVIVAKLLGWMKNHLNDVEVQAFVALFDSEMCEHIAGEWMRHYSSYLQHLDEFSLNYESSLAFFT